MYTTNIIEGLNLQYRKVTKKKSRNREALLSPHSCPLSIPPAFVLLPSVISFQTNIWLSDFLLFLNLKHIVWFKSKNQPISLINIVHLIRFYFLYCFSCIFLIIHHSFMFPINFLSCFSGK